MYIESTAALLHPSTSPLLRHPPLALRPVWGGKPHQIAIKTRRKAKNHNYTFKIMILETLQLYTIRLPRDA